MLSENMQIAVMIVQFLNDWMGWFIFLVILVIISPRFSYTSK